MASLKQNIKNLLIKKQHKSYYDEVTHKKKYYDMWIREQEQKLNGPQADRGEELGEDVTFAPIYYDAQEPIKWEKLGNLKEDFILFCRKPGEIASIALPLMRREVKLNQGLILIYGDEDVAQNGKSREKPWFKPDWSPDTFRSLFYFGSLAAVKTAAFKEAWEQLTHQDQGSSWEKNKKDKIDRKDDDNCNLNREELLYEIIYLVAKRAGGFSGKSGGTEKLICHIPEILYHTESEGYESISSWSLHEERCLDEKDQEQALVSIIIPSKDNREVLFHCIRSIVDITNGSMRYEIILVDNGSRSETKQWISDEIQKLNQEVKHKNSSYAGCRYLYQAMEFNFSKMCNAGVSEASGEIYLFLNDDMEVIQSDWLEKLSEKVRLPYSGAVGAKLLYPQTDMIQHAGITNLRVGPAHKLQFLSDSENHYYGKNKGIHNVMAVTGACLMVKKEAFKQAGGFSEQLAVAFNDVDLCYTLYEAGYYNIVRNDVVLYHHESLSRGKDGESEEKQLRLLREKDLLYEKHQSLYGKDPFYHKYLTSDMLESVYSPAYHYQVTLDMPWAAVVPWDNRMAAAREDKCLVIGMECAMDLYKWVYGVVPEKGRVKPKAEEMGFYFQGYTFVIGADNACYSKTLLLKNTVSNEGFMIPIDSRYREDIRNNLHDQLNVDLTGYAAKVQACKIPKGVYRFGMLAEERYSRQKLVNWSNWLLEV